MTRVQKAMLELAQAIKSEMENVMDEIEFTAEDAYDVIDDYQIENQVAEHLGNLFEKTHIKGV